MKTTILIVGGVLLGVALVFIIRAGLTMVRAARRAFAELRPLPASAIPDRLEWLLRCGDDGEFLVIGDLATERFVQLRKYVHGPGDYGLSFDFPRAPWSAKYYDELQSQTEHDGTHFVLQPTLDAPVTEFLQLDCGRDIELARRVVDRVLFDIFQVARDQRFRITSGQKA